MKQYKSLKEVEKEMQIQHLKTKIEEEKMNLQINGLRQQLTPMSIGKSLLAEAVKFISIKKLIDRIRGRK